jgi:hypothetical protein
MRNRHNPEAQPLIHKGTQEEMERNRPGSPYVKLDLNSDSAPQTIGAYYIDLQGRHKYWMREEVLRRAPEQFPDSTEVELHLLETLVQQDGQVNFWDASIEMMRPDGSSSTGFNEGCDSFVNRLGLEVQVVEQ